ncbi:MAG: hypothetical protein QOF73_1328, partial [Thermomicrobiales bacterium]|nr:hypothetical protein [Thermomicrobiales bacterium]
MNGCERRVLAEARAAESEMVDLLRGLIRINSENPPGRYEAIATAYAAALEGSGFEVEILPVPAEAVDERGLSTARINVIGRRRSGRPGPRVMLNAHLDTVPIGNLDEWTVDPLGGDVLDGKVWGRGAVDSKGRLAAYWAAATAVVRAGGPWSGELLVVATCDEE